jgi:hypothetical protein
MNKGREKDAIQQLQIQPLNDDVLGDLSIEELEERLELQILQMTEAQICWDCGTHCEVQCSPLNPCGANVCEAQCQPFNPCGADCGTLCGANVS